MPKRINNIFKKAITFNKILEVHNKTKKGKRFKKQVIEFEMNLESNIIRMGKELLNGKYKYYLMDLGIRQVKNIVKRPQLGAYLENIVYNELLSRGYDVKVGNLEKAEIDFIGTRFKGKIYIQVAYILAYDKVIDREFGAYKEIEDNFLNMF